MQGQNWSGPAPEQSQGFNPPPFFNNDGSMNQEAMQTMFQGNVPDELANQGFSGFDPASSANFSHPSQMMMQQHSAMGDPSQRFVPNMAPNGMDPAAAYGQMGLNAPASRRQSEKNNDPSQPDQSNDNTWNGMPNNMQGIHAGRR